MFHTFLSRIVWAPIKLKINCFLFQGPWEGITVLSKTVVKLAIIFVFYLKRRKLNSTIHKIWLTISDAEMSPALKPGQKVVLSTFTSNLAQRYNPSAAEASHRNCKILLSIFKGFFLQAAIVSLLLKNSIYVFSYPCDEKFPVRYRILCYPLFNKKICVKLIWPSCAIQRQWGRGATV